MAKAITLTTEDMEKRVLASLIDPATSAAAKKLAEEEKLDPEMFHTQGLADIFRSWIMMGSAAFHGMVCGEPTRGLATTGGALKTLIRHIVRDYRQRIRETDRTLDEFQVATRDEDDEDCLFKNRWLRRGGCGMIISSSGVGKSSFTMQAAVHWARGAEMLGVRPLKPLKVGIVQSEDDEYDVANFRDKIRIGLRAELKWTNEQIAEAEARVTFCAWDGSTGERFVEYIRRKQTMHHFDLIIVNPLHAFFGGDLKNADEVSRFLRNGIDRLIKNEETKCAMLFVHHTGKPSKDKIAEGDFFAGYLGSGSAELINYPRVALTLTPYKDGKVPGVFNLIGSKHGDKLAWKTADGKPTNKRTVCYANRLARHKADGCIYWVAPDLDDMEEIEKSAEESKASKDGLYKQAATALAEIFKREKIVGPFDYATKTKCIPFPRSVRQGAVRLIACDPFKFGLREVTEGKAKHYEADPAALTTTTNDPADAADLNF